ncbi:MAG TPA: TIGR00725 family protein [Bacteroidota bacterium]|nr:TIGR00725 family protein [Bacteroidota bacterium]
MRQRIIAVIGAAEAGEATLKIAEDVGRFIARGKAIMVCGGLGGVMEAAARGAQEEGGITVGILPQNHRDHANPHIQIPVVSGFGEGRNVIIARTADVLIAVGGEYGTLSEIAFGLKMGKPVIGIKTWDIKGMIKADSAEEAVHKALGFLKMR